ncbi:DUF4232 domain-containing protein [Streptomyces sp. NPDC017993]|uniref:DUF4232 domain-containing protein n=1 Tax=Streptomyces sp. NPDC017993 TaxID=3365027 RepID=UPI0037963876
MSLTAKTLGRGRRAAAGSLIALAALTLTACQDGSNSAAGPPSASSPDTAGSAEGEHSAKPSGDVRKPSGSQAPSADTQPSASASKPSGSKSPDAGSPSPRPSTSRSENAAKSPAGRCTATQMSLRLGPSDIGAGNIHYPLVFTNKGKSACSLRGYPGVSLMSRDGSVIGKPATREGGAGGSVKLQPGRSAHVVLHTVNDGVSDTPCWSSSQIVYVYPPGSKDSMTTQSRGLRVCGGRFTVTTMETGATS